jgi:hypothetical protein
MKIKLTVEFNYDLNDIVDFQRQTSCGKKVQKRSKLKNIKILKQPFLFKKSIYSDDENIRLYQRSYSCFDIEIEIVLFGNFEKHRKSL